MTTSQTTIIPHTQLPLVTREYPSDSQLLETIGHAYEAQKHWRNVPLQQRIATAQKFTSIFRSQISEFSSELSQQIGRPIRYCQGECNTMLKRADYLLSIAEGSLAAQVIPDYDHSGSERYIERVPHGVILIIVPWNYPLLVTINAVLPAIVSGNTVILKPSPQTPLTAERFVKCWLDAGLPRHVLQVLHLSPSLTTKTIQDHRVNFVVFTGSVQGGKAVEIAATNAAGFKGVALELGGKDPAYVREDAHIDFAVTELVDGVYFNSGQSCCAVERIYVHESKYDEFIQKFVDQAKTYKLGDPSDPETTLGPVISFAAAKRIRKQIADAVSGGARKLISQDLFPIAKEETTYVEPQVLVDVNHSMDIMMEETFGPVVGIMKVSSDDEAIRLMNDSPYGLTASIWTTSKSMEAFKYIASALDTGTVFLNKCDSVDPALCWTGVKNSGRGVSCSKFGYDQLTKPKSVYIRV